MTELLTLEDGLKSWTPTAVERKEIIEFRKLQPKMGWLMAETIYMYHKLYPQKIKDYMALSVEERLEKYPTNNLKRKGITIVPNAITHINGEFLAHGISKPCGDADFDNENTIIERIRDEPAALKP